MKYMEINAFDIETYNDNDKIIPYCISYYINNKIYSVYNENNICEYVINDIFIKMKKNFITIFIHNIEFDARILLENLKDSNYKIDMIIKNRTIYSMTIKNKNKKILFKCSYKLCPISLKKAAISFNIGEKLAYPYEFINNKTINYIGDISYEDSKMNEIEYIKFNNIYKEIKNIKKYTILYCENDVLLTKKLIEQITNIISKYNIVLTNKNILSISSLSLQIFYKIYNSMNLNLKYSDYVDKIVRKSYYGGRCEVFGNVKENEKIFHFDFPGMYSICMKENYPLGKYYIVNNPNEINKPGFYYIKYKSNMNIPILPHHNKITFKLLFTNGENEGLYWFEEILLFIKYGGEILSIEYSLIYEKYEKCFESYIKEFEELRNKGGEYKTLSKMIVNSLYGRLGMKKKNEQTSIINSNEYLDYLEKYNIVSASFLSNYALITYEKENNSNLFSNIAIASAITSKARIKLYEGYMSVINNGGRILYSDTDSIFAAYNRDVTNEKHGEIFWDKNRSDLYIEDAIFIAPKHYGLKINNKEIIKIKGLKTNDITINELKFNFINEIDIKKKINIFKKELNITNSQIEKIIKMNTYDKRKWIDNYTNTTPLEFKNGKYIQHT